MAAKKVTNVGKHPLTLSDGTPVAVGEIVSTTDAVLKGDPFLAAGWLREGEHVLKTSEDVVGLRKQITALENTVESANKDNESVQAELDEEKKKSEAIAAELVEAKAKIEALEKK